MNIFLSRVYMSKLIWILTTVFAIKKNEYEAQIFLNLKNVINIDIPNILRVEKK